MIQLHEFRSSWLLSPGDESEDRIHHLDKPHDLVVFSAKGTFVCRRRLALKDRRR